MKLLKLGKGAVNTSVPCILSKETNNLFKGIGKSNIMTILFKNFK